MRLSVFLDTGPLGLITNPNRPAISVACLNWAVDMMTAGHRLFVPAIADYEVRRELIRAGKSKSISALDGWNYAYPGRYIPLTDSALRLGATLWAQVRNSGNTTADPKELDADVLIAAQALDMGLASSEFVIATVNVGHLSRFALADLWTNIHP